MSSYTNVHSFSSHPALHILLPHSMELTEDFLDLTCLGFPGKEAEEDTLCFPLLSALYLLQAWPAGGVEVRWTVGGLRWALPGTIIGTMLGVLGLK